MTSNLAVVVPEPRNLIDGKLVGASSGNTFDNTNPASGEVIGACADATPADMEAAIAAARRAFDETTWSTDHALRERCLRQLHAGLVEATSRQAMSTILAVVRVAASFLFRSRFSAFYLMAQVDPIRNTGTDPVSPSYSDT